MMFSDSNGHTAKMKIILPSWDIDCQDRLTVKQREMGWVLTNCTDVTFAKMTFPMSLGAR
jgi:hypothetical protein